MSRKQRTAQQAAAALPFAEKVEVPPLDAWEEVEALVNAAYEMAAEPRSSRQKPSRPECDDKDLALYPMTDLGNAERFVARCRGRLIYVPEIGWFFWDGRRWARDGADEKVSKDAHNVARAIQVEAESIRGTDLDRVVDTKRDGREIRYSDKLAAWGRTSETAARLAAIVKLAAPYLAVDVDKLDVDPWRINVLNGTIIIRRDAGDEDPVKFVPHDPADLITKLAPVTYDPTARCPRYDQFIVEVQPTPSMQTFLHRWAAYSLTGDVGEQKLCFFYGRGKNGKSTLLDTYAALAGDYATTMPIETFLNEGRGRNAGQATPDLALLPGVRFLTTSEPEKGSKLAEGLIKAVTGGETILVRHLHGPYFRVRPTFKLTMSGNYRPTIGGTDEGIWRRVVLVPWSVTIDKPDPQLAATLKLEASGILNRLLDGLRDYLENGLDPPEAVTEATADYREDSDPLGRFIKSCVVDDIGARTASRRMHEVFVAWARASGEREWSPKGLAQALKERGFRSIHANGSYWRDCRLIKSESDFSPASPPDPLSEDGG